MNGRQQFDGVRTRLVVVMVKELLFLVTSVIFFADFRSRIRACDNSLPLSLVLIFVYSRVLSGVDSVICHANMKLIGVMYYYFAP